MQADTQRRYIAQAQARPHGAAAADDTRAAFWGPKLVWLTVGCWALSLVLGFQLMLGVLALVGFAAAIYGLRRPALGLLGIGMLCTLDAILLPLLFTGGLLRFNTFNYLLLGVVALSLPFVLRLADLHTRFMEFFLLLLALQLMVSISASTGVQDVLSVAALFGLLIYFARATAQDEATWYWLAVLCGVLAAGAGLPFYLQVSRLPYVNPNAWGFVPLTALFAIALGFRAASKYRNGQALLGLLTVANFVWVFMSTSRGHVLVATCCLLYIFSQTKGVSIRMGVLVGAVLLAVIISTEYTVLPKRGVNEDTLARIGELFNTEQSVSVRTSGRSELALAGWYIFVDHPFGAGTGSFAAEWARLGNREGLTWWGRGHEKPAHAAWVKTLAENGIPGILLLSAYVSSFLVAGWQQRGKGLLSLGLFVTASLALAFISQEYQGKGLWFLAAGATMLLHKEEIVGHMRGAIRRTPIASITRSGGAP